MALLFLDSFDHYTNADKLQKWSQLALNNSSSICAITAAVGRRGSQGWVAERGLGGGAYAGDKLQKTVAPGDTKCIVGFAYKVNGAFASMGLDNTYSSTTQGIVAIMQSGVVQVWFRNNVDGTISAYNGTGALLGTSSASMLQSVFYYMEFKVVIHDTTGTVDVLIDGIPVLPLTGVDTRNAGTGGWNQISIGPSGTSGSSIAVSQVFDDLYIADGTGSRWNDFMGDMRIDALYPTSNGTTRDFTPSTGTDDFAVVDEALANSDTDYLTGADTGDKVLMNFPNAPTPGAPIQGVQLVCQARKSDAGSANQQGVARLGSPIDDYLSAEKSLTSGYSFITSLFPENPDTGLAWVDTEFNDAEFGVLKSL